MRDSQPHKKRLRIAHLPGTFLPVMGGAEVVAHNIALRQHQMGHDVTVFIYGELSKDFARKRASDLPYRVVSFAPKCIAPIKYFLRYGVDLRRIWGIQVAHFQKKHRFDVWHFNSLDYHSFFSLPALQNMGVPSVGTCHGGDIQTMEAISYGRRLDPLFDRLFSDGIKKFTLCTAISESIRTEYLSAGVLPESIRLVPNGTDVDRIRNHPSERESVRAEMHCPADVFLLLTVGRNHPKKGFGQIPSILKEVLEKRKNVLWVVVGRGNECIREKAVSLGVGHALVTIPQIGLAGGHAADGNGGGVAEVPSAGLIRLFKAADAFVFPTLLESFGIVLVEAMAADLPVITTDAPGARDIISHEENGLISPVKDTKAMAENVLRVLSDRNLRQKIIEGGKSTALVHDWASVAERYCEVYCEAVPLHA